MKQILKKLLIIAAVLTVPVIYFFFDARKGLFPQCPFYFVTGFHCPGCGSQRALSALVHGDIFSAIHYNILLILFLPLLLHAGFIYVRYADTQQLKLWYNPLFGKIVMIVILGFWLLRNIPSYPFTILAPVR